MPPDMAELVQAGEGEAIREVLLMFVEETRLHLVRLSNAIDAGDTRLVHRLGHGLKGGCAQVGAHGLSRIAAGWEAKTTTAADWRGLMDEFEAEFGQVEAAIRAQFS
jgi:HPt (histidine-containing phosphotransfer) domain-containing protein